MLPLSAQALIAALRVAILPAIGQGHPQREFQQLAIGHEPAPADAARDHTLSEQVRTNTLAQSSPSALAIHQRRYPTPPFTENSRTVIFPNPPVPEPTHLFQLFAISDNGA